jgi:hypothetical protein
VRALRSDLRLVQTLGLGKVCPHDGNDKSRLVPRELDLQDLDGQRSPALVLPGQAERSRTDHVRPVPHGQECEHTVPEQVELVPDRTLEDGRASGVVKTMTGDLAAARADYERGVSLARSSGAERLMLGGLIFLADLNDAPALNELWDHWVPAGNPPIRACVQAGLGVGLRVEMLVTAAVIES